MKDIPSTAEDGTSERNTTLLFVKTFIVENGKRNADSSNSNLYTTKDTQTDAAQGVSAQTAGV